MKNASWIFNLWICSSNLKGYAYEYLVLDTQDVKYKRGDWLVFGSEVSGLPPEALVDCTREGMGSGTIKIPMVDTYVRCLNLSVSVGIALYEASRQLNYEQLQCPGAGVEGQRLFISEDTFGWATRVGFIWDYSAW